MTFEKIKKFLDEKIFHKKSQKLLMPGEDYENNEEIKVNLDGIYSYLENEKYTKAYKVFFCRYRTKKQKKIDEKTRKYRKGCNYKFT